MKVGFGFDVHPLVAGRPLVLGGVHIEHDKGLEGFSDGDAAAHAVIDALLGAAALGDCGTHFPAGDARFAGADSMALLQSGLEILRDAGFEPANIDCTIVAEAPALLAHLPAMREKLASVLAIDGACVSVKAKRSEGLGFTGEGKGIAAYAVALIAPMSGSARRAT